MTPFFKINFGLLKNKKIFFPNEKILRPTKQILQNLFISYFFSNNNIYFLDLFAGSGILGFEFFSLGLKKIIMIEINKNIYKNIYINKYLINKNTNNFILYCLDSYYWLKSFNFLNMSLIFMDPPYKFFIKNYLYLFNNIFHLRKCLFIFIESGNECILKDVSLEWFLIKKEHYGISYVYLFKKI